MHYRIFVAYLPKIKSNYAHPRTSSSLHQGNHQAEIRQLDAYAQEKNITPTQLYALLNGKEYLSLFSAVRFSTDFDLNIDYCTKGELPVLSPEHDYNSCWKLRRNSSTQYGMKTRHVTSSSANMMTYLPKSGSNQRSIWKNCVLTRQRPDVRS